MKKELKQGSIKGTLYRKKPIIIEAMQWLGENDLDIIRFAPAAALKYNQGKQPTLTVHTLEGDMIASIGDYIIKGVEGEFYPCKPDIFEKTYEEVKDYE